MSKRRSHVETDDLVGKRIAEVRKMRKMTQGSLARALDISTTQLHKYEKCINSISIGRLAQIAQKLSINIDYLLQDLDFNNSSEPVDIITPYLCIKDSKQKAAVKNLIIALSS